MDLILWRHAEAQDADGGDDLQRALTRKGHRQARQVAEWLAGRLAGSTCTLVSPALRCQQTAQALKLGFRTLDALGPDASPEAVLEAVGWPDAREPVLVVGHQPSLGVLAARLMGAPAAAWSVRKAAVWWLRGESEASHGAAPRVMLRAVIGPDLL